MNVLARTGDWMRDLSGRRRLLLAFAAGAVSATGFAPLDFFPAMLLGYATLVLLLDGADAGPRPVRRGAAAGWAFFFGQFLVGLHWIAYPFLIYPDSNLWQLPFALFLPAGLALFGGLACAAAIYFWQNGPGRIFIFAVMGASLAELATRRWQLPAAMALLFAALWGFGAARLSAAPLDTVPGVSIRLVQPNIPQAEKYVRRLMLRNWTRLLTLSTQPGKPTHIVWPEAATGFAVARAPGALDQIGLFSARGQTLITGSDRFVRDAQGIHAYNSLYLFAPGGGLPQTYDKFHLVPFGEYLPLAGVLGSIGFRQFAVGPGFSAGDYPHVLNAAPAPLVSPLICYEVIFPHAVTDPKVPRPGWLVNITDDSWFGPWSGPHQHLLTAQVRAIEEGLPIARAANTGISAMIDGYGRVRGHLALNRMGVVDAALPRALALTLYDRFGDLVFLLLLIAAVFTASGLQAVKLRAGK